MALARSTQATVTGIDVVGHLPREISRFCKFFYDYGGELSAVVRESNYRRSPIPQGGLKIPITLKVKIGDVPVPVYEKMVKFLPTYYLEPDKIPPTENLVIDADDTNDI